MLCGVKPENKTNSLHGFFLTLEAASAFILLIIAASTLPLFSPRHESTGDFFLCSDIALSLAKSGAFSNPISLSEKANSASDLSGMCVDAVSPLASYSNCPQPIPSEQFSFSFPVWQDVTAVNARVSCSRIP